MLPLLYVKLAGALFVIVVVVTMQEEKGKEKNFTPFYNSRSHLCADPKNAEYNSTLRAAAVAVATMA